MRTLFTRLAWAFLALLAVSVAGYAGLVYFAPGTGAPFVRDRLETVPLAMGAHLLGSAAALFLGAFQVNQWLRSRALGIHRWLGRSYVAAVAIGGLGALALATRSEAGMVTHIGFGMLAVCWLGTTGAAFYHIRRGEWRSHRRWMLRSYALTFAAVTLRVYLPLSLAAGISFENAYRVIAWLCWVPNLLVIEWWLRSGPAPLTPISPNPV
jgi:uncharacterized membrane protein